MITSERDKRQVSKKSASEKVLRETKRGDDMHDQENQYKTSLATKKERTGNEKSETKKLK